MQIQDIVVADATWAQKDGSYPKRLTTIVEDKKEMQKDYQGRRQQDSMGQ